MFVVQRYKFTSAKLNEWGEGSKSNIHGVSNKSGDVATFFSILLKNLFAAYTVISLLLVARLVSTPDNRD